MTDLVTRARDFATRSHAAIEQRRKYTGEPYINHPAAVVAIVSSIPHDEAMLAAAWLHDVVEDTGVHQWEIDERFGADVGELVAWLTDVSTPADGNRVARKAIDRAHSAAAPARAQTIKVADLIDNTSSIVERDPDFARVYMREKEMLMDVLTRADPVLRRRALDQLAAYTGIIH